MYFIYGYYTTSTIQSQLGPQQLKYMTVRSDSSARFLLSSPPVTAQALVNRLTLLEAEEEVAVSLIDLDAWSLMPGTARMLPWTTILLMKSRRLI